MVTALMTALSEKKAETDLRVAFMQLCEERHKNFHEGKSKQAGESWLTCGNAVCVAAREILAQQRAPEVVLTPLSFQLYRNYGINVKGGGNTIIVRLVTPNEMTPQLIQQVPAIVAPPSRVILTDES